MAVATGQPKMPFDKFSPDAQVKCDGCVECCKQQVVLLIEGDDPLATKAIVARVPDPFTGKPWSWVLPNKPNGDCAHLGPSGCEIYAHRPKMCRAFSCVGYVALAMARFDRPARRRMMREGAIEPRLWAEGLKRTEDANIKSRLEKAK